jgi:hypothetical protein
MVSHPGFLERQLGDGLKVVLFFQAQLGVSKDRELNLMKVRYRRWAA